jgi:phosphatidylserine/phosphatidylglycerophosphate/cardiolipin synthase-like enzyme
MAVNDLNEAVARIALEVHPDRIVALCSALGSTRPPNILATVTGALGASFPPRLLEALRAALAKRPQTTPAELSSLFRAASTTASLAAGASSVEWVWTGPATGLVPIRHTAQVLTGLIDEARERLFLVSFVAYNVHVVIDALKRATERGVRVSLLFESPQEQGGNVTVDSPSMLKSKLPRARFYEWDKTASNVPPTASVHAKCAVADGSLAFVTSANLSDAAMERNIELGILVRGGTVPRQLDMHLEALITTRQLTPL